MMQVRPGAWRWYARHVGWVLPPTLGLALLAGLALAAGPALDELVVPPGRFVDLGTHRLHYHCAGQGQPTVLIDAGIGGSGVEWTSVQQALATRSRVCTYDRAGYGWSDPGPGPRTTRRAVRELRALLAAAGIRPPYLLVGHSYGGFTMRYFAARHAGEVAGVLLVEASHPRALLGRGVADGRRNALLPVAAQADATDEPHAAAAAFLNSRRKAVFAQMDELRHFADSARQVEAAGTLGELPLIVLARDPATGSDGAREAAWQALQAELAKLSSAGELRIAGGSGHDVAVNGRAAVIAAVQDLAERAAAQRAARLSESSRSSASAALR